MNVILQSLSFSTILYTTVWIFSGILFRSQYQSPLPAFSAKSFAWFHFAIVGLVFSLSAFKSKQFTVRPALGLQKDSDSGFIAGGASQNIFIFINFFLHGSTDYQLVVCKSPALDLGDQFNYLIQYLYGCTEQTISAAFPQLYFGNLADAMKKSTSSASISVENIVIMDILTPGIEIENPRTKELPGMDWIKDAAYPTALDVRDDRIHFFVDLNNNRQSYYYAVRAVSPSLYRMGPVSADALYNGEYHLYYEGGMIRVVQ